MSRVHIVFPAVFVNQEAYVDTDVYDVADAAAVAIVVATVIVD